MPYSPVVSAEKEEEVTLVPFGSENIRVTVFPTIGTPKLISDSYTQNFDNNTAEDVVIYGGGWYYKDNAIYCASNGKNSSGNIGSKVIINSTRFSNFIYSADVAVTAPGDAGLMFRVSDPAIGANNFDGYYLALN
ncbi:MAG: hypothetical protein EOP51_34240, partial [Sphingobacteriales bacterium]